MPSRLWASAAALAALGAAALPAVGYARQASLEAWLGHDLSPYVVSELSSYPL